jgi:hypothetical protein
LHLDLELLAPAVGVIDLEAQLRARLGGERDADKRDPSLAFARDEHRIVAQAHARRLFRRAERNPCHAAWNRFRARKGRGGGKRSPRLRGKRCCDRLQKAAPVQMRAV